MDHLVVNEIKVEMKTVFIGDVHGCAAEFETLLGEVGFDKGKDRLLLTGDVFTRGAEPLRVWELIQDTGAVMVIGNHDERMVKQLRRIQDGKDPQFKHADQARTMEALEAVLVPLFTWLLALPLCVCGDGFVLVHAGINPELGIVGTSREEFLAIRTWPPIDSLDGPRWHDYYRPEERLLLFGHDAPGGLVIKERVDGMPYLVGLDSGCVYGNQLSGYILEEERLVQVQSRT
jgi:hypothetical protein